MNPLLEQFVAESRELLQGIGSQLMALEREPDSRVLLDELFRQVHTLKGNSGLFDLPELTRLLHAAEDLMDGLRSGQVPYARELVDTLLQAADLVAISVERLARSEPLEDAGELRALTLTLEALRGAESATEPMAERSAGAWQAPGAASLGLPLQTLPEALRLELYRQARQGQPLHGLSYRPDADCFFKGEDPLLLIRQAPRLYWARAVPGASRGADELVDVYRCELVFQALCGAPLAELEEHFRYVPEQVRIEPLEARALAWVAPQDAASPERAEACAKLRECVQQGRADDARRLVGECLERCPPEGAEASVWRWLALVLELDPGDRSLLESLATALVPGRSPAELPPRAGVAPPAAFADDRREALAAVLVAQRRSLAVMDPRIPGNLLGVGATLDALCNAAGLEGLRDDLNTARQAALAQAATAPLLAWLERHAAALQGPLGAADPLSPMPLPGATPPAAEARPEAMVPASRTLRVDQGRIDRLMDLIGEIVVAKNGLPYLAARAEEHYGVRELSREIKAQYAVINRIAEELQDAIMQVRVLPLSYIFQRFPRLVRDLSRKLGKEVELVLEGEDTEVDKNIVEALADPLIHILRNSLDHGLETRAQRLACGKPETGRLTIRAVQDSDQVLIDILDDGRGIDPAVIRRKALEKGFMDEAGLARLNDTEVQRLVFAAGFSTAAEVSDLSGRGVGMDVVRNAIEKVNGSLTLDSTPGQGTRVRLALPLSLTVSSVMMVEADGQLFGIPLDQVAETVRIQAGDIRGFKHQRAILLRERIVPLTALHDLLALGAAPRPNAEGDLVVLVVRINGEPLGILVDGFRSTLDIILKPMAGVLARLPGYAGSALLGDGSVLLVLDLKELL